MQERDHSQTRAARPWRAMASALALSIAAAASGCGDSGETPAGPAPDAAIVPLAAAPNFRLVTAGGYHACGIATDGRGYCWGANFYGELGDGTTIQRASPGVEIAGGHHWLDLSAGLYHTCGVGTDSLVYCWGFGAQGELGDGMRDVRGTPLAAGTRHYKQVNTGDHHSCAVTAANRVFCWGYNSDGQLGDGTFVSERLAPVAIAGTVRLKRVIAGGRHTCGVTPTNQAWCWGAGEVGQLGDGTTTFRRATPKLVAGGISFLQVSAGDNHTCGIAADRRGYCWGGNLKGQLGDNTINDKSKPHLVAGGLTYGTLVAGTTFTCGVSRVNVAYCWGTNTDGQLGDGTLLTRIKPTAVAGGLAFSGVDAGNLSTCGVTTGKRAYCWGFNAYGQVGNGSNTGPDTCRSNLPCAKKPQAVGS
ncbi:MAG: RCC1 domain-containing protein [Actinoallomurus sp.]